MVEKIDYVENIMLQLFNLEVIFKDQFLVSDIEQGKKRIDNMSSRIINFVKKMGEINRLEDLNSHYNNFDSQFELYLDQMRNLPQTNPTLKNLLISNFTIIKYFLDKYAVELKSNLATI